MRRDTFSLAIVTEVFPDPPAWDLLPGVLDEAKLLGAELAVLPEIPLNPWSPATKAPLEADAEDVDGPRQRAFSAAASESGVAVLGGAIIKDPDTGVRHNTALLYDGSGSCLARYRKVHLPSEEGFWETSHYEPGHEPPTVVSGLPMKIGFQVCSDVNRTTGFQLLGAMGAELVLVPRCTPPQTYERWKLVLRANAVTSGCYVVSSNRPAPTPDGLIGGPSIAISPTSEVLLETTDRMSLVTLSRPVLEAARKDYPGYLKTYPGLYARAWKALDPGD
ncbi:MAG: carbon-nitrogen hydrolase family protein [Gemmatimonadota bacterium]|jgi:predicted amidohydrolase